MQTSIREFGVCRFTGIDSGMARRLPAVLCSAAPLELQGFCGEGDAAR